MTATALELAEANLDLLYERDAAGLLVRPRDHDVPTPLFHLVRTVEGNRWLLAASLSAGQRATLDSALRAEPTIASLELLEGRPPALREALLGRTPSAEHRGPAFVFPEVLAAPAVEVRLASDPHALAAVRELAWVRAATRSAHPLCVAFNSRSEAVAVCHSSRSTPTAAAAGVETAEAYRRRGLATAVVAGWAAAVRAEGRLPLYGTTWENAPSRAVARKLGLVMSGEDWHVD